MIRRALRARSAVAARACAVAALLVACEPGPTRVLVIADSDLEVPARLDAVRFVIDARAIGGDVDTREVALGENGVALPLVLPVLHEGGPLGPISIAVEGLRSAEVVVVRAARISFVRERSLELPLFLAEACVGTHDECADDATCVDGECVALDVDANALIEWAGDELEQSDACEARPAASSRGRGASSIAVCCGNACRAYEP